MEKDAKIRIITEKAEDESIQRPRATQLLKKLLP